jgi:hypothetical protein
VDPIKIDIIGLQPLEASFQCLHHTLAVIAGPRFSNFLIDDNDRVSPIRNFFKGLQREVGTLVRTQFALVRERRGDERKSEE